MISIKKMENTQTREGKEYFTGEIVCNSSDTKPIKVVQNEKEKYVDNGTTLVEMDTSKIYFFDLDSESWKEF